MHNEPPDLLRLAILAVLATADGPLTPEEIAEELARLTRAGQHNALGGARERGH